AESTPQSVHISAGGLRLYALERNPGGSPTVLFLHGWLDHCHSFDWLGDQLPRSWRQVAVDFRGHGQSDPRPPGALYNFTDYLADVNAVIEHLGTDRIHLVGHSLGGAVALFFAAARPERIQSVTLIDSLGPGGGPAENAVDRLRHFVRDLSK